MGPKVKKDDGLNGDVFAFIFESVSELLPRSPVAVGVVSFAAGISLGVLCSRVLTSRPSPHPLLGRLAMQSFAGLERVIPGD